jgi:hypothetical protein
MGEALNQRLAQADVARQQKAAGGQLRRGDAENYVGQTLAGAVGGYGGGNPGYPTPVASAPPEYEDPPSTGTHRPGFIGCMREASRAPRPEQPETAVTVRDQLRNAGRALELIHEAAAADSAQQWAAIDQMHRELRSEINSIKMYLGI